MCLLQRYKILIFFSTQNRNICQQFHHRRWCHCHVPHSHGKKTIKKEHRFSRNRIQFRRRRRRHSKIFETYSIFGWGDEEEEDDNTGDNGEITEQTNGTTMTTTIMTQGISAKERE